MLPELLHPVSRGGMSGTVKIGLHMVVAFVFLFGPELRESVVTISVRQTRVYAWRLNARVELTSYFDVCTARPVLFLLLTTSVCHS